MENEKKEEEGQLEKEETEEKRLERVEEKVEEVPAEEKEKREVQSNSFLTGWFFFFTGTPIKVQKSTERLI